jgi:hypothetical protein
MKITFNRLSTLLCVLALLGSGLAARALAGSGEQKVLVEQAYETHKLAIIQKNSQQGIQVISQASIAQHDKFQRLALHGTKKEIRKQPLSEQVSILTIRKKVPFKKLQKMDGKKLYQYTIKNGWTPAEWMKPQTLSHIKAKGNKAKARVLVDKKFFGLELHFVKEDDLWKVDLPSLSKPVSFGMKFAMQKEGLSEEAFIISAVGQAVGKPVDGSVWEPLLKK